MSISGKAGQSYIAVGMLSACFFMGCASSGKSVPVSGEHQNDGTVVEHAWREREAAFAQVTHAIADYCTITSESVVARQGCMIGKQRELDGIRGFEIARRFTSHVGGHSEDRQTGHILHCEGRGRQTVCDRKQPVLAEVPLNDQERQVTQ
jgi:hypothetical protein